MTRPRHVAFPAKVKPHWSNHSLFWGGKKCDNESCHHGDIVWSEHVFKVRSIDVEYTFCCLDCLLVSGKVPRRNFFVRKKDEANDADYGPAKEAWLVERGLNLLKA